MDGYNFLHAVQAHPEMSEVPVILMAAKVAAEEEHRALAAGFIDFIAKPAIPVRVMATAVRQIFARPTNSAKIKKCGVSRQCP